MIDAAVSLTGCLTHILWLSIHVLFLVDKVTIGGLRRYLIAILIVENMFNTFNVFFKCLN